MSSFECSVSSIYQKTQRASQLILSDCAQCEIGRETGGKSEPISVGLAGYKRAFRTDLLERDMEELPVADKAITLDIRPYGFAGVRLLP